MKRMKKIIAFALMMIMLMAMSTVAFAEEKTTITVNNLGEGAEVTYAQVIKTDRTTTTGWEIVDGYVSAFQKLPGMENVSDTQKLIEAYINASESQRALALNDVNPENAFTNGMEVSEAGLYVIKAKEEGYEYSVMAAYVGFDYESGATTALHPAELNAKKAPSKVEKVASEEYVEINDEITYTVTATVPYIPALGEDETVTNISFAINDKISGANYKAENEKLAVVVKLDGVVLTDITSVDVDDNAFSLNLSSLVDAENTNANKTLTVEYVAVATSIEINNEAYPTINGNDFNTDNGYETTKIYTYSGKISITKYDEDNNKLAGAEFVVKNSEGKFATLDNNDQLTGWVDDVENATKITTGDDGIASAQGDRKSTRLNSSH